MNAPVLLTPTPTSLPEKVGGELTPFSQEFVTFTRQEYIQRVSEAHFWRTLHKRAVERLEEITASWKHPLEEATQKFAQEEAELKKELEAAQAKVRDLQQRIFGRKTERQSAIDNKHRSDASSGRNRGHQAGNKGHGRTLHTDLPVCEEIAELEHACCSACGEPFSQFPGTDDCEIVEIEVKAHRRIIHRKRYKPGCTCEHNKRIVTAPTPNRLIERGKRGISVWVHILLDKFNSNRPTFRLLQDLGDLGLRLSAGTVTGGLKSIAPLIEPFKEAFLQKRTSEKHWHADETRWAVFEDIEGKSGHRWYLWIFVSALVSYYVLDPSRSAKVPKEVLGNTDGGILSVDRYAAYKSLQRAFVLIIMAYCWAHQRRDFLSLANAHPDLFAWAMDWVERIRNLFALQRQRLEAFEALPEGVEFQALDKEVRHVVNDMAETRREALADPNLQPPAIKLLQSMEAPWDGLTTFVEHPTVPPDNNTAERGLRGPVVGRKNYYGSGYRWSGHQIRYNIFADGHLVAPAPASSKTLSLCARQLPNDWSERYGFRLSFSKPLTRPSSTVASATKPPIGFINAPSG